MADLLLPEQVDFLLDDFFQNLAYLHISEYAVA